MDDISGGLWRNLHYPPDDPDIPPAYAPFEMPKKLITFEDGARFLLKFCGICTAPHTIKTLAEAARIRNPNAVAERHGWVYERWLDGSPLRRRDLTPDLAAHIGAYIAGGDHTPMTQEEHDAAITRLREWLYWNTWEAFGEADALKMRAWADTRIARLTPVHPYRDGHLAPHEWIRTPGGIVKVDAHGHHIDHTVVGMQPFYWDIAAARIEWEMDEAHTGLMLRALGAVDLDLLALYEAAYLTFMIGKAKLCAEMSAHDPAELKRLQTEYQRYINAFGTKYLQFA